MGNIKETREQQSLVKIEDPDGEHKKDPWTREFCKKRRSYCTRETLSTWEATLKKCVPHKGNGIPRYMTPHGRAPWANEKSVWWAWSQWCPRYMMLATWPKMLVWDSYHDVHWVFSHLMSWEGWKKQVINSSRWLVSTKKGCVCTSKTLQKRGLSTLFFISDKCVKGAMRFFEEIKEPLFNHIIEETYVYKVLLNMRAQRTNLIGQNVPQGKCWFVSMWIQ